MTPALALLALGLPAGPTPAGPTPAEVRAAVDRAVPILRRGGERWIEKKKCVSCHRIGNAVWSLGAAERAGFPPAGAATAADWAVAAVLAENDAGLPAGSANREGVAQLLLAGPVGERLTSSADRARLASLLRAGQGADGLWPAGGQLPMQRRPPAETAAVSSLWIALGLLAADGAAVEPAGAAARGADAADPGTSTEWFAARLLLAVRLKQPGKTAEIAAALRTRQRPDGGWGWVAGDPGDALGTGLAVHSLVAAGALPDDPAVAAGRRFLLVTQRPDGSWAVPGTKRSAKGAVRETASYWGTAWAVLGLLGG